MNYHGVIIKESLRDQSALAMVTIHDTRVETVTERHQTPWLKHWTLCTIEVDRNAAPKIARALSAAIDPDHADSWYIDFKNDATHYIIFYNRVFHIDQTKPYEYAGVRTFAINQGIPEYQLSFSPPPSDVLSPNIATT